MECFHWGENFITGFSDVDEQHKHLVDIINSFGNLITNDNLRMENIHSIYGKLAEYANYHFTEEEKLMSDNKIDNRHFVHHVNVHKIFIDDVTSIYSSISKDNIDHANIFIKFLIHWLAYHILGDDQDMANQLRSIQSGISPEKAYDNIKQERINSTAPLLEALNGLFEQVSIRNKELKNLNESLEEKVALRTRDLSEANHKLEELSLTDTLTGLPNRRHAIRRLSSHWDEAMKWDIPLTCIMIDADHFKEVNDNYGHDIGDKVLKMLAKTLQDSFRTDDIVCRLGGDEFLAICPTTDAKGAEYIANSVLESINRLEISTGGDPWKGSVSIGTACYNSKMTKFEDLIKAADEAVYAAKKAGKNCVRSIT